ncbi:MAG TPA: metalloregulator ArsR/SmtB family transcription factor [Gemmataceae bacterium]|jgi:ArsR family transcriptional regulator|nr:metalloregulator ArsR/SmtB family transcription factor [Gemmataceae bacterium]
MNHVSKTRNHKPLATLFTPVKTSDQTIHRLSEVFKIMSDKSRLKILLALAQDGELHVTALCDLLTQSQPAVSHHLTLMRMTGLVGYRRDGKHNYYYLQSSVLRDLIEQFFSDSGSGGKHLQFEDFSLAYKRK